MIVEEKNIILNEGTDLERFIEERIKQNKELFTNKEISIINQNKEIVKKIYMLGAINFNNIWHTFWHTKQ